MQPPRSGSAILLCLGLASIAVMVGFAFLRAASRQDMSGTSEILDGLARDAARSGLAHATEQILADFNASSLKVVVNATSTTVSPVPTHLDGPYRAPFASLVNPQVLRSSQQPQAEIANGTDDVQEENHLLMPLLNTWKGDDDVYFPVRGLMIYEGRGRYYEPGYYDITRPDPAAATPLPVAKVLFSDPAATASERSAPLFLDRNLHRLTGTSASERKNARYRVRYAVGVEDLQGHLLMNPRADMNLDWTKANNDYRVIPPWLNAAGYVWNRMTTCIMANYDWALYSNKPTLPLRMDHIFRGRGSASNADRAWALGTTKGQPAAFPLMFRAAGRERNRWSGGAYPRSTGWDQWWGDHTWDGNYMDPVIYDGVYDGTPTPHEVHGAPCYNADPSPVANQENLGGRLYRNYSCLITWWNPPYPPIDPNPAGGQILTPVTDLPQPYVHALLGPQLSWYNHLACAQGNLDYYARYGLSQDGYCSSGESPDRTSFTAQHLVAYTPFGRRMEQSASAVGQKWYQGAVDSPWLVNALTAAPQTVSQMLLAYVPPYFQMLNWNREDWYLKTNEWPGGEAYGDSPPNPTPTIHHTVNGPWTNTTRGLDILNDQLGSGFADFPAPSSVDAGFPLKPDYYQDNPEPRPIAQRYPGPLCRGNSTQPDQGSDDLGQYIDADGRGIGFCTHTGKPFLVLNSSGDKRRYEEEKDPVTGLPIPEPGATWNRKWLIIRRFDSLAYKYRSSYFFDLSYAMTQALAFARATWVQYPNVFITPSTAFNPASLRDPRTCDTLAKLDRLFLRQLGENYDNPGTPCPDEPIIQSSTTPFTFTKAAAKPPQTIASLATGTLLQTASGVSSAERAKVMERMLNDFRLSFFGVSPAYRASFQPLDFDGDHKVQCSCYDINPAASANELQYKTARWQTDDGAGRGPAPTSLPKPSPSLLGEPFATQEPNFGTNPWFCATGAFFIGKSHYYRVFVRGEVFDNLIKKPIATSTLESVLAVDPEATIDPHDGSRPASNKPYTQILFQRWHYNDQTSELPRHVR